MTKSEQVINECIVDCTKKMYETLKMFGPKNKNTIDKVLVQYDMELVMKRYLRELQKND